MVGKIVGGAFAASVKLLVQHMAEIQASTLESVIRGRQIYKPICSWRLLVGEIPTLEREEDNNHDKFAVSLLKHATVTALAMFLRVFAGVLTLPKARRDHHL